MCNSNIYNMYLNILIGVIYAFVCVSTYIDIYVCVYIFFFWNFWGHGNIWESKAWLFSCHLGGSFLGEGLSVWENSTVIRCSAQWSPFIWTCHVVSSKSSGIRPLKDRTCSIVWWSKAMDMTLWPGSIVLVVHGCEGEWLCGITESFLKISRDRVI